MSDEKKIIIDEDWKSRVAAEKEALARDQSAPKPGQDDASSATASAEVPPLPPASFEMLVTTLATEAMIGLGQIPHPMTGKVHADADQARYAIDMIEMLAEKTRGNLTPGEEHGLQDLLHQLRMAFLATRAVSGQQSAMSQNTDDAAQA
jgi:hypothetical protein